MIKASFSFVFKDIYIYKLILVKFIVFAKKNCWVKLFSACLILIIAQFVKILSIIYIKKKISLFISSKLIALINR